jgi:hypothetical protein
MNSLTTRILAGLLAAQLLLAIGLHLAGADYTAFEPEGPLVAFDADAIDGLTIADADGSVRLARTDDGWVLPDRGDFPADTASVDRLLENLGKLEKGWPVATTAGALERFEVANDTFERRIALLDGDAEQAVLYVGTSPGLRKAHLRPAGDDQVYAGEFSTWEAGASPDDWIDKDRLTLDADSITAITLPDVKLERDGETFKVVDLADGETARPEAIATLVSRLSTLRIQSVAEAPDLPDGEPSRIIELTRKDAEPLTYQIWKADDDGGAAQLRRSDVEQTLDIAGFLAQQLIDTDRAALVEAPVAEEPEQAEADQAETDDMESDEASSPSAEPTDDSEPAQSAD